MTAPPKTASPATTRAVRRLAAMLAVVGLLAALGAGGAAAVTPQSGALVPSYGTDASWWS